LTRRCWLKSSTSFEEKASAASTKKKTVVVEDPDNGDTLFFVELDDDAQGQGQEQQEQFEIQFSEETMQALLDQARNGHPPVAGDEDEE